MNAVRRVAVHLVVGSLLGAACCVTTAANVVTLTFDELPYQPVDGLSFQGVTFDFKIDGTDSLGAFYHSFGPGNLVSVQDPSLNGDSAGILTLDFDVPTTTLQFGAALNTGAPLSPGFTVELFDESLQSLGTIPVDTVPTAGALGFSEAPFDHAGTAIMRAVIDFADGPGSFALDNLVLVPKPPALAMWLLGFALAVLPTLRRTPPCGAAMY